MSAEGLFAGDVDGNGLGDISVDFGAGMGLWVRRNDTVWQQLHPSPVAGLASGNVDVS